MLFEGCIILTLALMIAMAARGREPRKHAGVYLFTNSVNDFPFYQVDHNDMSSLFPDSLSRPYLPPFRTLLVNGPYHPSAPIHLCFSHTRIQPQSKTVFLTPSRSNFKRSLEDYNDDWLTANSGLGKIAEISSRIEVLLVFRLVAPICLPAE